VMIAGHGFDRLDADEPVFHPPLPNDVSGSHVVSDTVYPSPEGASLVEMLETAPKLKMNLLNQVTA
jgi:hypothetical protein